MVYSWSLYVKKRELPCNCSLILTALRSLVLWSKEYGNKGINSLCLRTSVLRKTNQNLRPPDTFIFLSFDFRFARRPLVLPVRALQMMIR